MRDCRDIIALHPHTRDTGVRGQEKRLHSLASSFIIEFSSDDKGEKEALSLLLLFVCALGAAVLSRSHACDEQRVLTVPDTRFLHPRSQNSRRRERRSWGKECGQTKQCSCRYVKGSRKRQPEHQKQRKNVYCLLERSVACLLFCQ
jgi:hypothetical protein